MRRGFAILLLALLAPLPANSDGVRIWRDSSGNRLSAHFLWADQEQLYLKLGNGKELTMPLGRLSNDDLEFVREWQKKRTSQGVVYEAPLVWEIYRSKNFKASEAEKAGYYPLNNNKQAQGNLRLEFRRFGPAPKLPAGQKPVLRLTTANRNHAGTTSRITVEFENKIVGAGANVAQGASIDIPLPPAVLASDGNIELTVRCGSDTVMIQTSDAGSGPRLLVAGKKPE